jgi:DNA polymerase bacteriophage-type
MIKKAYVDFESRSLVSLKDAGPYVYSQHPSTEVLCFAVKFEDNTITSNNTFLQMLIQDPEVVFVAHNAQFDRLIFNRFIAETPISKWRCTMAKARSHGLPASLEKCAKALNLPIQKDMEGNVIMRKFSNAKNREPNEDEIDRILEYCITDIDTTILIDRAIPDLHPQEQQIWELDQKINDIGFPVDLETTQFAIHALEKYDKELEDQFHNLGLEFKPSQRDKVLDWVNENGAEMEDMKKASVTRELKEVSGDVKETLEIRQEYSKTSCSKLYKLVDTMSSDRRIRGATVYHAATTGRWGGAGVQPQNFPRPTTDARRVISILRGGSYSLFHRHYPKIKDALASSLRSLIQAEEGKTFLIGDYASIEARVTAWCSGQTDALDIFRAGGNLYIEAAKGIFGYDIGKKTHEMEYMVGKVSILALGYQGGINAFGTMSQTYGLDLEPIYDLLYPTATEREKDLAEFCWKLYDESHPDADDKLNKKQGLVADIIKQRWRAKNPKTVQFWADVESAAIRAATGGRIQCGPVTFFVKGDFLYCELPSGRCLAYHKPMFQKDSKGVKLTYMTIDSVTKQYVRRKTYGGLLTENIVQAISRDILAGAMLECDAAGFEIILHVHDEIVVEDEFVFNLKTFQDIMEAPPQWGLDIPISVEAFTSRRYKK